MPRSDVVKARVDFIVRDGWVMGRYLHILLFVAIRRAVQNSGRRLSVFRPRVRCFLSLLLEYLRALGMDGLHRRLMPLPRASPSRRGLGVL